MFLFSNKDAFQNVRFDPKVKPYVFVSFYNDIEILYLPILNTHYYILNTLLNE